jgi:HAD superfamily hydrolase (TIGR01509 family)
MHMSESPYRAIIFDFYGVISSQISREWMADRGVSPEDRQAIGDAFVYTADRGLLTADEVYLRVGERFGLSPKQVHDEWLTYAHINPEVIDLITSLKQHYKVGLCSNAFAFIRDIFKKTHVDQLFDVVAVSAEIGTAKPDSAMFEYILNKLEVSANESVFIDDQQRNVDGAARVGITSLLFTSVPELKKELASAGITF